MSAAPALELAGTVVGILVALAGALTVWVKLNSQIAVLQDRSDHEDDDTDGGHVADLRRTIRAQEDRIGDLERDLRREREAREEDNRRNAREIGELRELVAALRSELTITRNQLQGRTENP